MTYSETARRLGIDATCFGGCGITVRSHRTGFVDPFGVVHFAERRMSKRGLRRWLLLCAKRARLANVDFLNDPALYFAHFYLDERRANEWAAQLGVRFPIAYSLPERRTVSLVPGLSRSQPAVYAWAQRGVTP